MSIKMLVLWIERSTFEVEEDLNISSQECILLSLGLACSGKPSARVQFAFILVIFKRLKDLIFIRCEASGVYVTSL